MAHNKLKFKVFNKSGRNRGRISSFHRGGGVKKLFRIVDFWRYLWDVEGRVLSIEKDPNRTGPLALVCFSNGILCYILASDNLSVGSKIQNYNTTFKGTVEKGSSYLLGDIPAGSKIYNLEFIPGDLGKLARSAGNFCILVKHEGNRSLIKLPSGEYRLFSINCRCSYGRVGNVDKKTTNLLRAGVNRRLGKRPIVRGRAMNPVDHPHGGRTNGGITPKTPWGLVAFGKKTRKKPRIGVFVGRKKK